MQSRLERLLRSLEEEADLTTVGRYMAREVLVLALANRLFIDRCLAEYPEILQSRVEQPLFVAGFARTGTTLLHRLLALDDAARAGLWEFLQPVPPPMPAISPSDKRAPELIAKARCPFAWLLAHFADPSLRSPQPGRMLGLAE